MNLNTPQWKALRDYLDAVKQVLLSSGSTAEDFENIQDDIYAHVTNQLCKPPYTTEAVAKVVSQLDPPESYKCIVEKAPENKQQQLHPKSTKAKPWIIAVSIVGGFSAVLIILVIVLGAIFVKKRNQFVLADEQINQSAAQVQVVLQRRYDLIPNLVETVKGYAKHESTVFQEVVKLRKQWDESKSPEEKRTLSIKLEPSLGKVIAVAEQYPDLKANQNFIMLQTQLESSENRIAIERRRLSLSLRDYNALIKIFPGNIVATVLGYETREDYFEALTEAQAAIETKF